MGNSHRIPATHRGMWYCYPHRVEHEIPVLWDYPDVGCLWQTVRRHANRGNLRYYPQIPTNHHPYPPPPPPAMLLGPHHTRYLAANRLHRKSCDKLRPLLLCLKGSRTQGAMETRTILECYV